jgi:hypothetical protein
MKINHVFYKTYLINMLQQRIAIERQSLLQELTTSATDVVVWKRRFRMLSQLAAWESQVTSKIYAFETENAADYQLSSFIEELMLITSRNG